MKLFTIQKRQLKQTFSAHHLTNVLTTIVIDCKFHGLMHFRWIYGQFLVAYGTSGSDFQFNNLGQFNIDELLLPIFNIGIDVSMQILCRIWINNFCKHSASFVLYETYKKKSSWKYLRLLSQNLLLFPAININNLIMLGNEFWNSSSWLFRLFFHQTTSETLNKFSRKLS